MKRKISAAVAVLAAVVALLAPAAAAHAGTISAGSFVCTIKINNPHESHHQPDTVNVTSSISCNTIMPRIEQRTLLFTTNNGAWAPPSKVVYDKSGMSSSQADAPCSAAPATFYAINQTWVTWPVGYSGPTYAEPQSPNVYVSCASSKAASAAASSAGSELTFTMTAVKNQP